MDLTNFSLLFNYSNYFDLRPIARWRQRQQIQVSAGDRRLNCQQSYRLVMPGYFNCTITAVDDVYVDSIPLPYSRGHIIGLITWRRSQYKAKTTTSVSIRSRVCINMTPLRRRVKAISRSTHARKFIFDKPSPDCEDPQGVLATATVWSLTGFDDDSGRGCSTRSPRRWLEPSGLAG